MYKVSQGEKSSHGTARTSPIVKGRTIEQSRDEAAHEQRQVAVFVLHVARPPRAGEADDGHGFADVRRFGHELVACCEPAGNLHFWFPFSLAQVTRIFSNLLIHVFSSCISLYNV